MYKNCLKILLGKSFLKAVSFFRNWRSAVDIAYRYQHEINEIVSYQHLMERAVITEPLGKMTLISGFTSLDRALTC